MSQCEAAESSSQLNPQFIDGRNARRWMKYCPRSGQMLLLAAAELFVPVLGDLISSCGDSLQPNTHKEAAARAAAPRLMVGTPQTVKLHVQWRPNLVSPAFLAAH